MECCSLTGLGLIAPGGAASVGRQPLLAARGPGRPLVGFQGNSIPFQDVRPHLFQWGLSLASCQGQPVEGYFLFRGIVVI